MIRENTIKQGLKQGASFVGTFVKISDPAVVEILALAGFDFIVIDNEHTQMNLESTLGLIRAADLAGILPTVRVRENHPVDILQALDAGALGVQVPQVDTKEQAQRVVNAVKYAPVGKRGYAASQRSAAYGFMNATDYATKSNAHTMISVYCETVESVRNLDQILTVDEIDIVFIGPFDLSQALGVIGQPNHPRVLETIADITKHVRAAHKATGIIASDAAQTKHWIESGIQYIVLNSDLGMIATLSKQLMKELKG